MTVRAKISCGVVSCNSRDSFKENISHCFGLAKSAIADQSTDWLSLPEVFDFIGTPIDIEGHAGSKHDYLVDQLSKFARQHQIVLFAGSIHEPSEGQLDRRCYNTSYVFDRSGSVIAKYRKIHLFELLDDAGNRTHSEAETFMAGDRAISVKVDGFSVGLSICYDLRFVGLFERLYRLAKPDILLVPAAFTKMTGQAHWELLLRARAVEYQCYVIASNQCGDHGIGKESFGHAMIIDPWGEKLCDSGENPGFCHALVDSAKIRETRVKLPSLANRRPALYY